MNVDDDEALRTALIELHRREPSGGRRLPMIGALVMSCVVGIAVGVVLTYSVLEWRAAVRAPADTSALALSPPEVPPPASSAPTADPMPAEPEAVIAVATADPPLDPGPTPVPSDPPALEPPLPPAAQPRPEAAPVQRRPGAAPPRQPVDSEQLMADWMVQRYGLAEAQQRAQMFVEFYTAHEAEMAYWRAVLGHLYVRP
jgi:hypothetical protein